MKPCQVLKTLGFDVSHLFKRSGTLPLDQDPTTHIGHDRRRHRIGGATAPATVGARLAHLGWSGDGGEEGNRRRWHGEALWRSCRCGGGLVRRRRVARPPDTDGDGELWLSSATEYATTNGGHGEDRELTLDACTSMARTEKVEEGGNSRGGASAMDEEKGPHRLDSSEEDEE